MKKNATAFELRKHADEVDRKKNLMSPEKNAVLAKQRQYLQTLLDDLRRSIKEGKSMTQTIKSAAQSEREHWILFDGVNARNATLLFPALEWE